MTDPPEDLAQSIRADADYYGLAGLIPEDSEPGPDDVIKLNVGGKIFITTRKTLCVVTESLLADAFSSEKTSCFFPEIDGAYFLDYNPESFGYALDVLREFASDCACEDDSKEATMELDLERLGSLIPLIVPPYAQLPRMKEAGRVIVSRKTMNADGAADDEELGAGEM